MSGQTILVVDDENLMVDILQKALMNDHTQVIGKQDPRQAIEYVREHSVDLVITDVLMPHMRGTQLFHELRVIHPFLQCVIMTGHPTLELITQMLEAGVSDFIIKPFKIDRVRQIVGETLTRVERWKHLAPELVRKRQGMGGNV